MKGTEIVAIVFGVLVLSLFCVFFGLRYFFLGRLTMPSVKEYQDIAKTGLPLAQAITDYRIDHGLLPQNLDELAPKYWNPSSNKGWSYGGNSILHHAGVPHCYVYYWFDGGNSNEWSVRGEGQDLRLNTPSPSFTRTGPTGEQLFTIRLNEYERRSKKDPAQKENRAKKLNFLASEKREELLKIECLNAAQDFPHWWFPRMVIATLDKNSDKARADFETWIKEHPSFVNFCYLAYYHRDVGDTAAALRSLEQAAACSFQAYPNDSSWVGAAFAFDAAKFAYEHRRFDLTRKICERWETLGPSYGEKSWLAFKAAADLSLGQCDSATELAQQAIRASAVQAMWAENLNELLRHASLKNTNFVYRAGNACSDWSLFSALSP